MSPKSLYDTDYYTWVQQQFDLLKSHRFSEVDLDNVLEEIKSLGFEVKTDLSECLTALLTNLIVWSHSENLRSRERKKNITLQRFDLEDFLNENSSLRSSEIFSPMLEEAWGYAKLRAANETNLDEHEFPQDCPWNIEQILGKKSLSETLADAHFSKGKFKPSSAN